MAIAYIFWSIAAILVVWFVVLVIRRVKAAAEFAPEMPVDRRVRHDPDVPEETQASGAADKAEATDDGGDSDAAPDAPPVEGLPGPAESEDATTPDH